MMTEIATLDARTPRGRRRDDLREASWNRPLGSPARSALLASASAHLSASARDLAEVQALLALLGSAPLPGSLS